MDPTPRTLLHLHVSPWSERARWVLDHHRLPYRKEVHLPFFGERRLRRLVGPKAGRATVPILIAGGQVLTDSWDIAVYADHEGAGAPLLPATLEPEIRRWNDRADALMEVGRALITASLIASPRARDEALPPAVPRWIRPLLRPITGYVMAWFARKYALALGDGAAQRAALREALLELRAAIPKELPYLLGAFSYADIAVATSLQGISPVADRHLRLGPATRAAWTDTALAEEFPDLLAWRDQIYDQHRRYATNR